VVSGTYPIRASESSKTSRSGTASHEARVRLMERRIENVVDEIRRDIPMHEAPGVSSPSGATSGFAAVADLRAGRRRRAPRIVPKADFLEFCGQVVARDTEEIVESFRLSMADAETLAPALLAYGGCWPRHPDGKVVVLEASLRMGLVLDLALQGEGRGIEEFRRQVLASAASLGQEVLLTTSPTRKTSLRWR